MVDDTEDVDFGTEDEEEEKARRSAKIRHPIASFVHLFFRVAAIVTYLLCDWFSKSFASCFVLIITLLSCDFWSVKSSQGQTEVEARIFWLGLIICPLLWTCFLFTCLFSLKVTWLALVVAGLSLQLANLYGYLRCKAGGQEVPPTTSSSFLGLHFLQRPDIIFGML
ncbi:Golgi apparatus membrane protein TVP23 homolog A-like isoform X2 [Osmerus mordax]|uniref:Golgi apparatus membrane protein TVP23 homolog A-like isoform X2 n=1 Tax=Osmerus mordax TaxID=8014 RepID=UPI0035108CB5